MQPNLGISVLRTTVSTAIAQIFSQKAGAHKASWADKGCHLGSWVPVAHGQCPSSTTPLFQPRADESRHCQITRPTLASLLWVQDYPKHGEIGLLSIRIWPARTQRVEVPVPYFVQLQFEGPGCQAQGQTMPQTPEASAWENEEILQLM